MNVPFPHARVDAVVDIEHGTGNLDVRAYIAALLGPQRAAFGNKGTRQLIEGQPTRLATNAPAGRQVSFIAVTLLAADAGGPRIVMFDGESNLGSNSLPVTLDRTLGSYAGVGFTSVLLPGDEVYAQPAPGQGAFSILVSQVWF